MIIGVQIVGILFGLFMMYYTFLHYKRGELTSKNWTFWLILWSLFIIVTLFPQLLDPFVVKLHLARTMDLFIILGFMFLVGISVYTNIMLRKNQKKIEDIVRAIALQNGKENKNS